MSTLFTVLVTPVPLGSLVPACFGVLKSCQVRVGGFGVEVCQAVEEVVERWERLEGCMCCPSQAFRWQCSCNLAVRDISYMFCEEDCGWGRERQAAGKARNEALTELAGPFCLLTLLNPAT